MYKIEELTQKRLKELLNYDHETGLFVWQESRGRVKEGRVAGSAHKAYGYTEITLDRKSYPAHRLVWLYNHGVFPVEQVDHLDGNRTNNRLENLREVSHCVNGRNRTKSCNNSSGITGVYLRNNYWIATWINILGKPKQKSFNISKYGNDCALDLATTFREGIVQELNTQGAGYTSRHGN
jgi:hypothetical protein